MPLAVMEQWRTIPRQQPDLLSIADQEAAVTLVEEFFRQHNPVEIDGVPVTPVLQRLDFDLADTRDPGLETVRRPVNAADSWVAAVLSYNTAGAPNQVQLEWTMFNDSIYEVTALVFASDQQSRKTFTPEDAVFQWKGMHRRPPKLTQVKVEASKVSYRAPALTLILLCAALIVGLYGVRRSGALHRRRALLLFGAAVCVLPAWSVELPSFVKVYPPAKPEDAAAIFESLHKNVYRAFDYRTESGIYDALARSVSGELLRKIYQDIRQGLEMKEQGRAMSRVSDVRIVEGKLSAAPPGQAGNTMRAFRYDATWTVSGLVGHWGHSHERTNRYHAVFTVELDGTAWKITAIEILSEERLAIKLLS
jgi:hypothetical protein